jgi:hypothetical protein
MEEKSLRRAVCWFCILCGLFPVNVKAGVEGFRGFEWGTPFSEISPTLDKDAKVWERKANGIKPNGIGVVELTAILANEPFTTRFYFIHGELYGGYYERKFVSWLDAQIIFKQITGALTKKYGNPTSVWGSFDESEFDDLYSKSVVWDYSDGSEIEAQYFNKPSENYCLIYLNYESPYHDRIESQPFRWLGYGKENSSDWKDDL